MTHDYLSSMTLQKLRIFAAVAHERSFTRAADVLHLSPPAVSEEIKSLESILGLRLLLRSRGQKLVDLTEAGEILLRSHNAIMQTLANAANALDTIKTLGGGAVAFGVDGIFGTHFLPVVYGSFCQTYPCISVHLEVSQRQHILESLARGHLDIAVVLGPIEEPGLANYPLIPCHMVPVGRAGHRLAGGRPAPFRELAVERLILADRFTRLRRILDRMAAEAGITFNIAMEVGSTSAQIQAVLSGLGISVISSYSAEAEVDSGRMSVLSIEGFPVKLEWFVVHPLHQLSPGAQALKDYLLNSKSMLEKVSISTRAFIER